METVKNIVPSIIDFAKVELHPSLSGYVYRGEYRRRRKVEDMISEFSKMPLLTDGILELLWENQEELIPDEWKTDENGKTRRIFFLGNPHVSTCWMTRGQRFVSYIYFYEGSWREGGTSLQSDISEGSYVAVFQE
jgi:hypothetical protein